MTDTLTQLFDRKEQLMQHIRSLDELIKLELQEAAQDGQADETNTPAAPDAPAQPAAAGPDAAQAAPSGNPAYDKLSWRKKILHHLGQADGRGMTTADLTAALQSAHHGQWRKPAVSHTLYLMERDGLVRMQRGKGHNLHFLPGSAGDGKAG